MLGFAIKKTFFDLWDNLFFAMTVNLLYTLAGLGLTSLAYTVGGTGILAALTIWPMPLLATALLGGIATFWARDIAVSGTARFVDVLTRLGESWKVSLVFGAAWLVVVLGLYSGVGFYTQINPILGF